MRVRRIENLSARIPYLRLSSPSPREEAILADIRDIHASISDPRLVIRGAVGRAEIWSDSARLDLPRITVGASQVRVSGPIAWPDTIRSNLPPQTLHTSLAALRTPF